MTVKIFLGYRQSFFMASSLRRITFVSKPMCIFGLGKLKFLAFQTASAKDRHEPFEHNSFSGGMFERFISFKCTNDNIQTGLHVEPFVQECDATMLNRSTTDWLKKNVEHFYAAGKYGFTYINPQ